jgi:GAF domain-containing protein
LIEPDRQAIRAVAVFGLDPQYTNARREYWTPVTEAQKMFRDARQITTLAYEVGRHKLAPDFANCILLSLLDSEGLLVGMIAFDTEGAEVALSDALLRELEIVANQAATAIVNARLANDQTQTVDRLTALNALSLAVTTTLLSTDEIMQMTVAGAVGTTNGLGGGQRHRAAAAVR